MSDLQSKSDEELNVMLAGIHFPQFPVFIAENGELRHHYDVGRSGPAFNYCADLNAVANVEAGLTDEEKSEYAERYLPFYSGAETREQGPIDFWKLATASARQRTIALIQTLTP